MKQNARLLFGVINGGFFALFIMAFFLIMNGEIGLNSVVGAILGGTLFGVGMAVFMGSKMSDLQDITAKLSREKVLKFEELYRSEDRPPEKEKKEYIKYLQVSRKNSKNMDIFLYIIAVVVLLDVGYSIAQGGSVWDIVTLVILALLVGVSIQSRKKYDRVMATLIGKK